MSTSKPTSPKPDSANPDNKDKPVHPKSARPDDAAPLPRDIADEAAMRDQPEDKSATARRTTPAGKGRSQ